MTISKQNEKPNISYLTYGEIVRYAMENKYSENEQYVNVNEQTEFVAQLVININHAIEDREIIPVDIKKADSGIGDISYYTESLKLYLAVFLFLCSMAGIKYLWDKPEIKSAILKDSPTADLWGVITGIMLMIALVTLLPLSIEMFKFIKIHYLMVRSHSTLGMIKYQLQEAKYRKYIETVYYRSSAIDFINSTYNFNIDTDKSKDQPNDMNSSSEPRDKSAHSDSWMSNPLLSVVGVTRLITAPRNSKKDAEISEKFRRLAQVRHEKRMLAKENIENFIYREFQPPCTCYHNQIARYIIKNQKYDEFEARLTFIDLKNEVKTISATDLTHIAKQVMKKVDSRRVYDRTISLKMCDIHRTM